MVEVRRVIGVAAALVTGLLLPTTAAGSGIAVDPGTGAISVRGLSADGTLREAAQAGNRPGDDLDSCPTGPGATPRA